MPAPIKVVSFVLLKVTDPRPGLLLRLSSMSSVRLCSLGLKLVIVLLLKFIYFRLFPTGAELPKNVVSLFPLRSRDTRLESPLSRKLFSFQFEKAKEERLALPYISKVVTFCRSHRFVKEVI